MSLRSVKSPKSRRNTIFIMSRKIALICIFYSSSAFSQALFGCQEVAAVGFRYLNHKWEHVVFKGDNKFFLKVDRNGTLDPVSARKGVNPTSGSGFDRCEKRPFGDHVCSDSTGASLIFNAETGEGAISRILGAAIPAVNGYRDSLSVSHFFCQRM